MGRRLQWTCAGGSGGNLDIQWGVGYGLVGFGAFNEQKLNTCCLGGETPSSEGEVFILPSGSFQHLARKGECLRNPARARQKCGVRRRNAKHFWEGLLS